MIYKTLIIFDTNIIRHTNYVGFELGRDYDRVKKFINENNLREWIKIAIPEYVIEEIGKQKIEQFESDFGKFKDIGRRLEKLGLIQKQRETEFNIRKFLDKKLLEYTQDQDLRIIRLSKINYGNVFERVIERAIAKKSPFKRNEKHSDFGFKDVLIWETILDNRGIISWNDNVFFCSADNGFGECKDEFEKLHNKNFEVFSSVDLLMEKLGRVYFELIENSQIFSLVKTAYFTDQIKENINAIGVWDDLDGDECDIVDAEIIDRCTEFEKVEGDINEGSGDIFKIESLVTLYLEKDGIEDKIESDIDIYVTTTIDINNEFIDFEIN